MKKLDLPEWSIETKALKDEELLKIIKNKKMSIIHHQLETEIFENLNNSDKNDLFVIGKEDITTAIMSYMLKKLYITKKLSKKLFENFEEGVLNFEINIIEKLEDGDAGDRLKQFGGLIGIYYYVPN